jgi:AcrR family transcriptional regulator
MMEATGDKAIESTKEKVMVKAVDAKTKKPKPKRAKEVTPRFSEEGMPLAIQTKVVDDDVRQARLAHLAATSAKVMLEKGFHGTSVREIAEAAGWPMGTLYLYIMRKEDVLYLIARRTMITLADAVRSIRFTDDPWHDFEQAIDAYYRKADEIAEFVSLNYREVRYLAMNEQFDEILTLGREAHDLFVKVIRRCIEASKLDDVDSELVAEDILVLGHARAVRIESIAKRLTIDEYIKRQTSIIRAYLERHKPKTK